MVEERLNLATPAQQISLSSLYLNAIRSGSVQRMLEKLSPDKSKITAAGIEDARFLETEFPGLRFVRIEANRPLPFADQSFDVVFSHEIGHGDPQRGAYPHEHGRGNSVRSAFIFLDLLKGNP